MYYIYHKYLYSSLGSHFCSFWNFIVVKLKNPRVLFFQLNFRFQDNWVKHIVFHITYITQHILYFHVFREKLKECVTYSALSLYPKIIDRIFSTEPNIGALRLWDNNQPRVCQMPFSFYCVTVTFEVNFPMEGLGLGQDEGIVYCSKFTYMYTTPAT